MQGPRQSLTCGSLFWKLTGLLIIVATLVGLVGSFWFAWKIRNNLDNLAREQEKSLDLRQASRFLQDEEKEFFSQTRIETVAEAELSLYPPSEKYLGGGITVRVPRP